MKKVFWGLCESEFEYGGEATKLGLFGKTIQKERKSKALGRILFEVTASIEPIGVPNGEHVDVCPNCRMSMLAEYDSRPKEK